METIIRLYGKQVGYAVAEDFAVRAEDRTMEIEDLLYRDEDFMV